MKLTYIKINYQVVYALTHELPKMGGQAKPQTLKVSGCEISVDSSRILSSRFFICDI